MLSNFKMTIAKNNLKMLDHNVKFGTQQPENARRQAWSTRTTLTTNSSAEKSVGLSTNTIKERYSKHKQDLAEPEGRKNITMADDVLELM